MYADENDGFKYLLCVVDHFSNYPWTFPLRSKETVGVVSALESIFFEFGMSVIFPDLSFLGPPRILHSDNGGEFLSKAMEQLVCFTKISCPSIFRISIAGGQVEYRATAGEGVQSPGAREGTSVYLFKILFLGREVQRDHQSMVPQESRRWIALLGGDTEPVHVSVSHYCARRHQPIPFSSDVWTPAVLSATPPRRRSREPC